MGRITKKVCNFAGVKQRNGNIGSRVGAIVCNLLLVYVLMMVTRVVFYWCNVDQLGPHFAWRDVPLMLQGALLFDTSAIFYVNALYLLLALLPWHGKERAGYYRALRWVYVVTNSIALAMNLIDSVYYHYSGKRTTAAIFNEFSNDNLTGALLPEVVSHWYLVLLMALMVWALWRGYRWPRLPLQLSRLRYYITTPLWLVVAAVTTVMGIRGINTPDNALNVLSANTYVTKPVNTSLVLNTPFSFIRTLGHSTLVPRTYMSDAEALQAYNPIVTVTPNPTINVSGKNVVILLLESMSREYVGALNRDLYPAGKSLTPFLDSIVEQSLSFDIALANGRKSVDAMPSIFASLPMVNESLFTTIYSGDTCYSLPMILNEMGYHTAFMHGADNLSMHFSSYMQLIGVQQYVGMNEYVASGKYGGRSDFGNAWGIWDDKFLQFDLDEIEKMPQPFAATLFTLTLHPPHKLPDYYTEQHPEDPQQPFVRSIRYTDGALRHFFERASTMPWYRNTLFVILADHSASDHLFDHYGNDLGRYAIPILLFTPDGSIAPQHRTDVIAQQTDLMPTLLGMLQWQGQILSFGCDLFTTPADQTWAFQYNNGIYQLVKGDYLLQYDGERTIGVYDFRHDPTLSHNLAGKLPTQPAMERQLQSIVQQYLQRVTSNHLLPQ